MSAFRVNRTRRYDGNDVNDPEQTSGVQCNPARLQWLAYPLTDRRKVAQSVHRSGGDDMQFDRLSRRARLWPTLRPL
jgi:hypothetical protein